MGTFKDSRELCETFDSVMAGAKEPLSGFFLNVAVFTLGGGNVLISFW